MAIETEVLHLRLTKDQFFKLLIDFKKSVTNHDTNKTQLVLSLLVVRDGLDDKYFVTVLTV